jgi:membrane fusion protein (multidrug efflux system)
MPRRNGDSVNSGKRNCGDVLVHPPIMETHNITHSIMKKLNSTSGPVLSGTLPHVKSTSGTAARITVVTLVLLVTAGAILITVPWLYYRHNHVVASEAIIKGTVAKLGARIDGQVKKILVVAGQHVVQGDILLQLEDQHLQAALLRAQAELDSATNELYSEKLAIDHDRRRLALEVDHAMGLRKSADATLEGAQSTAENLEKEFARITALMKAGIAASSEMDRLTGERGKSQANVKYAIGARDAVASSYQTATVQLDGLRVREARLGILSAAVAVARANVAVAEADLSATVIRAPEDGWVIDRIVEVGGSAKVGEPMLSLWIGRPWVEAWVTEKVLRRLEVGSRVDLSLEAFPGRTLSGRIESIGLLSNEELGVKPVPSSLYSVTRRSAMVPVRVAIENNNLRLQPGLTAVVGMEKQAAPAGSNSPTEGGNIFSMVQDLATHLLSFGQ